MTELIFKEDQLNEGGEWWHAMRKEADGTWSSKNGECFLYDQIPNALSDEFIRSYLAQPLTGPLHYWTECWCKGNAAMAAADPPAPSTLVAGVTAGDPHLTTVDGLHYNLQAVGELTLTLDLTDNMEVQVRTAPWPGRTDVAMNVAVAARVGDGTFSLYADGTVRINHAPITLAVGTSTAVGTGTLYNTGTAYVLVWPDNTQLHVQYFGPSLTVQFYPSTGRKGKLSGLFGNYDGNVSNDIATRNGTILAQPIPITSLYNNFAESWRITQAASLFDYAAGQTTETFTDRSFPHLFTTTQDLPATATAMALAACQAAIVSPQLLDDCIFDVGLTGDAGLASALAGLPLPTTPAAIDASAVPPGSTLQCGWNSSNEALNGSAVVTATGTLRLTDTRGFIVGSAFWNQGITWSPTLSFSTFFALDMGPNIGGGDGLAFVIQSSANGAKAMGSVGGALGYGGSPAIQPSIAIEFDTFQNAWDPNANHVALLKNGDVTTHLKYATPSFTLASATDVFAWIDYDAVAKVISVYVSNLASKPALPLFTYPIDITAVLGTSAPVYVGFSAGTGIATNNEDVHQWTWSVGGQAVTCKQP